MKRLLPVLMGFVFLLLSATEGWSADCPRVYDRGNFEYVRDKWGPPAEQGDARAQYRLGCLYYYGQETKKMLWQEPYIILPKRRSLPKRGSLPERRQPTRVSPNYLLAAKWFTLSAEQGDANAGYYLGVMYSIGQGVHQDDKTAVKWFTLSAEQGDADAQWSLGAMYSKGRGVPQDDKTAVKWYTLAAKQGRVRAFRLGMIFKNGQGSIQDYVYAHMWFNFATSQGHAVAAYERDLIAKEMTPSELEKAKELAKECVKKNHKWC